MPNHDNIRRSVASSTPPVAPPHSLLRHRAPSARLGGQPLVARQQVPPIRSLHHVTSTQQRLTSAPLLHPKAGHPAPASACRQVFRAFPGGPNNNAVTSTVTAPLNTNVRDVIFRTIFQHTPNTLCMFWACCLALMRTCAKTYI